MSKIKPTLYNVSLKMEFEVGRTQISLGDFVNLKKGTPIRLENSKKGVIKVFVNEEPFGNGEAVKSNGERYVKITEIFGEEEKK